MHYCQRMEYLDLRGCGPSVAPLLERLAVRAQSSLEEGAAGRSSFLLPPFQTQYLLVGVIDTTATASCLRELLVHAHDVSPAVLARFRAAYPLLLAVTVEEDLGSYPTARHSSVVLDTI